MGFSAFDKIFLVSAAEIAEKEYDFSFNEYTEAVYERIECPPTEEILANLEVINRRISKGLEELGKMPVTKGGGKDPC